MRKQLIALLLCGIMAATMLGGCGKTQTSSGSEALKEENFTLTNASNVNVENTLTGDEKVKDAIVIATTNDMPSAAPYGSNNTVTAMLTNSTFNRLVKVTADNEVVPEWQHPGAAMTILQNGHSSFVRMWISRTENILPRRM